MRAQTDTAPGVPGFAEWVTAREHALQRFGYLTTGDLRATDAVVELALESMHLQWRELADVVDLEIFVRQEILQVQASRRHHPARSVAVAGTGPPSDDDQLGQVWEICQAMSLEQRAALVLHYAEQMDVVDIAEVLGRDPEDARDLVSTGIAAVSSRVGTHGDARPDPESLLRDTFGRYAARAPVADDLAGQVARVTRRRRRRQSAVGVVAVVALLVPVAWLASPASPEEEEPPARAPGVPSAALPDMRLESYGGIAVRVPEDWGYGDLTQWCADDGAPGHVDGPAVDRGPVRGGTSVCVANSSTGTRGVQRPTYTAGLLLRPAEAGPRIGRADVANGAPIYRRRVGAVDLTVIDVERALAEQILGSASVIVGADFTGCVIHANVPDMGRLFDVNSVGIDGVTDALLDGEGQVAMSICHYESEPWGRPTLVFSERLGRTQALSTAKAMALARRTEARVPADVGHGCVETEAALVRFWSGGLPTDVWVHYAGCGPNGIDDGVWPRRLTPDVLRPILDPPWSGTVGEGVPWPDRSAGPGG